MTIGKSSHFPWYVVNLINFLEGHCTCLVHMTDAHEILARREKFVRELWEFRHFVDTSEYEDSDDEDDDDRDDAQEVPTQMRLGQSKTYQKHRQDEIDSDDYEEIEFDHAPQWDSLTIEMDCRLRELSEKYEGFNEENFATLSEADQSEYLEFVRIRKKKISLQNTIMQQGLVLSKMVERNRVVDRKMLSSLSDEERKKWDIVEQVLLGYDYQTMDQADPDLPRSSKCLEILDSEQQQLDATEDYGPKKREIEFQTEDQEDTDFCVAMDVWKKKRGEKINRKEKGHQIEEPMTEEDDLVPSTTGISLASVDKMNFEGSVQRIPEHEEIYQQEKGEYDLMAGRSRLVSADTDPLGSLNDYEEEQVVPRIEKSDGDQVVPGVTSLQEKSPKNTD